MENKEKVEEKVEAKVEVKEEVKVRADLNDMVAKIGMKEKEQRWGNKIVCEVRLFNGETIEFNDRDGLYDLLKSYQKAGIKDFIKSKKLVEEIKSSKVDIVDGEVDDSFYTYVCVVYELIDGVTYRLFPARRYVDRRIIDNYYQLFKKQQNVKKG